MTAQEVQWQALVGGVQPLGWDGTVVPNGYGVVGAPYDEVPHGPLG